MPKKKPKSGDNTDPETVVPSKQDSKKVHLEQALLKFANSLKLNSDEQKEQYKKEISSTYTRLNDDEVPEGEKVVVNETVVSEQPKIEKQKNNKSKKPQPSYDDALQQEIDNVVPKPPTAEEIEAQILEEKKKQASEKIKQALTKIASNSSIDEDINNRIQEIKQQAGGVEEKRPVIEEVVSDSIERNEKLLEKLDDKSVAEKPEEKKTIPQAKQTRVQQINEALKRFINSVVEGDHKNTIAKHKRDVRRLYSGDIDTSEIEVDISQPELQDILPQEDVNKLNEKIEHAKTSIEMSQYLTEFQKEFDNKKKIQEQIEIDDNPDFKEYIENRFRSVDAQLGEFRRGRVFYEIGGGTNAVDYHHGGNMYGDLYVYGNVFGTDFIGISGAGGQVGLGTDESVFNNVHIEGDLRVDGNTYLSGDSSGVIYVGDTSTDNVVFLASVDSSVIPDGHCVYDLGDLTNHWQDIYTCTVQNLSGELGLYSQTISITGDTIIHNNLAVSGTSTLSGDTDVLSDLTVHDNLTVSGSSVLSGDVHIHGDLVVDGNISLSGDAGGNIFVGDDASDSVAFVASVSSDIRPRTHCEYNLGSLTEHWNTLYTCNVQHLTGDLRLLGQTVTLSGDTVVENNISVSGTSTLSGSTNILSDLTVHDNLVVSGTSVLSGDTSILSDLTVQDNLVVSGTSVLSGDTSILSDLTVHDNLTVSGTSVLSGDTDILSDLTVHDNLTVSGSSVLSGDVHIHGDLVVDGNISLSGDAGGNIFVGDDASDSVAFVASVSSDIRPRTHCEYNLGSLTEHWNTLYTCNVQHLTGDLRLLGQTVTLSGDTVVENNISVSGTSTLSGSTNILSDLTVHDNLVVSGTSVLSGDTSILSDLTVQDNLVVSGTSVLSGSTNILSDLTVHDNLVVSGTSVLSGDTDILSDLTVQDNLVVSGTGILSGDTSILSDLTVHDNLIVSGTSVLSGDVHVHGDLTVDGNTFLSGGVNGTIYIGNSSTDNVSFGADIDSDIIPDDDITYDIGSYDQQWQTLYVQDVSASRDVYVANKLHVSAVDISSDVTIDGDLVVSGTSTLSGDTNILSDLTVHDNLVVSGSSTLSGDVHIHGDLRVDGSTYLSAGSGSNIYVGDSDQDNIVFNADVGSSIIPQSTTFDLGSTTTDWGTLYIQTTINSQNLTVSGTSTLSGDTDVLSDLTVHDNLIVSGTSVLSGDVHVHGDLVVDGNAFLSAGTDGAIYVGNSASDNVVFRADVDSNVVPDKDNTYTLGTSSQRWQQVHSSTIVSSTTGGFVSGGTNIIDILSTRTPTTSSAPVATRDGDLWWSSDEGKLKIYYDDGDSQQWVDASPTMGGSTQLPDPYDQSLDTTDDVVFNTVTTDGLIVGSNGPYVMSTASYAQIDAQDGTRITGGAFRLPNMTTTERDNLVASNGDMIYNTTTNKLQAYQNGSWINIDGT